MDFSEIEEAAENGQPLYWQGDGESIVVANLRFIVEKRI